MSITIRNINKEKDLENFVEYQNLAHADYPGYQDLTVKVAKQYIFDAEDFDVKGNFLALEGPRIIGRGRGDVHANFGTMIINVLPEAH